VRRPDARTRTVLAALCCAVVAAGLAGVALAGGIGASEPGGSGAGVLLTRTVLLGVFVLLLFLPFLPSVAEVFHPQDEYPLPVNLDYSKDPRYLGRSAWRILDRALEKTNGENGSLSVRMSKDEIVEVSGDRTIHKDDEIDGVMFVDGNVELEPEAACARDLYVTGDASIGRASSLRTLASKGRVRLEAECRVSRWIDAEGGIETGEECALGASAASGGAIRLGTGTEFRRLYGHPVGTGGTAARGAGPPLPDSPDPAGRPGDETEIRTIKDTLDLHENDLELAPGRRQERPVLVKGDLKLGRGAILTGPARVYGRTLLEPGALVLGDLFCEGPVEVGEGAAVRGNLFSQDTIELGPGVSVGEPDAPKSVVAKKAIRLAAGVRVHGYLLTEGEGKVV